MNPTRSLALLRLNGYLSLLIFIGGLLYLPWWYFAHGAEPLWAVAVAVGGSVIGLGTFVYINKKISHKIDLLTSQSEFAIDTQFMALFERSPVPYIIVDGKGNITKINQTAVKLLLEPLAELLNTNLLDRFVASEKSDVSIIINKIKSGVTLNDVEVAVQVGESEQIWVLLSSYTSPHNEQSFISLVDITQAKRVDAAKSEFLALATHQLGTPIAAIRWNTELLKKRVPEELQTALGGYVEKIQGNTTRMSALIDDFLNVSKLELGTFATERKPLKISPFLDDIVDEYRQKLEEKQLTLNRNEQPPDFSLTTDERLLHIVVSNLLSNATKYVKDQGTIWLSTSVVDGQFYISVADNGIGIPRSELDNLFTKFFRASNATTHRAEGTGLGLYVVKQAAEQLGGTVEVETDTDKGANFTVKIPIKSF